MPSSAVAATSHVPPQYRSYARRWCLLWTVTLLNVANYAHWISYASVYSKAVVFYQGSTKEDITRILTVSYGLGIPFSIVAPFVVSKYGLRFGLYVGAILTFVGSLMCCLSTFPVVMIEENNVPPIVWYWMTLVGQALTGMASPFLACIPTKVSQGWFDEKQGPLATAIIGLSQPIGIVLGQGVTPLFVRQPSDVPLLNIIWFVPAAVGLILALTTIKTSMPPTPPSRSASIVSEHGLHEHCNYIKTIRSLLTNIPCLLLSICIGGAMGYLSGFQTMLEPIMCVLGYSNDFSGLCGALVFVCGILGSFVIGFILHWIGHHHAVVLVKVMTGIMVGVFVALIFVMQLPNQPAVIAIMCSVFGFVSIGSYPTMLELAVEATYPICEALTVALISISASVQGVTIMELDHYLATPIPNNTTVTNVVTCHGEMVDHTYYLYVSNGYVVIWSLVFIFFFQTKFHRTAANKHEDIDVSTIVNVMK